MRMGDGTYEYTIFFITSINGFAPIFRHKILNSYETSIITSNTIKSLES